MTYFPAEPGTWLIDIDLDVEPIPIIGWAVSGHTAEPIVPTMNFTPVTGQAFRLAGTGAVVDPVWSKTFESEDAWRAAAGRSAPYEPGEIMFDSVPKKPAKPAKPAASVDKGNAPAASDEVSAEVARQLSFGKKSLKNKSFWRFLGGPEAVFIMEGGKTLPIGDDVDKITRDTFYELRKELTEATIDPDNLPEQEEGDDEDEDEDDTGGLI